jgi:2-polyprenyl-3-methyl-5-hydroxy-6-metoxy-1,4-benzoquinol methylase
LPYKNVDWNFFRCNNCGYWSSRGTNDDWPRFNYENVEDLRSKNIDWEVIIFQTKRIMERKFQLVGMKKGHFLDIGCSEGAYVAASAALGWTSSGIEIDSVKVNKGKSRNLDLHQIDILSNDNNFSKYDFVMLRHVIEHIPEFVLFTSNAAQFVAPGGVLWIECPNQSALSLLIKRRNVKDNRFLGALYPPTHIHAFESKALLKLGKPISLKMEMLITYAPSDQRWFPPYQYNGSWYKKIFHSLAAKIGAGDNICIVFRKE